MDEVAQLKERLAKTSRMFVRADMAMSKIGILLEAAGYLSIPLNSGADVVYASITESVKRLITEVKQMEIEPK